MKTIILILIYTGTFMGIFFLLSLIGLLWNDSYYTIISTHAWFVTYTIFLGWWLAGLPTREYYMKHEEYFDDVF